MFDLDDAFYRPLWIRLLLVAICLSWGLVEIATGSPGWGIGFLALAGWLGWRFFVTFDSPGDDR